MFGGTKIVSRLLIDDFTRMSNFILYRLSPVPQDTTEIILIVVIISITPGHPGWVYYSAIEY
jgi:hypothetical protein